MGVYHNLRKDIKNELLIICLFISKFAKDSQSYLWFKENYSLTNDRRTTTLNFLEKLFNIKQSRIKNIEDYYDKFFSKINYICALYLIANSSLASLKSFTLFSLKSYNLAIFSKCGYTSLTVMFPILIIFVLV